MCSRSKSIKTCNTKAKSEKSTRTSTQKAAAIPQTLSAEVKRKSKCCSEENSKTANRRSCQKNYIHKKYQQNCSQNYSNIDSKINSNLNGRKLHSFSITSINEVDACAISSEILESVAMTNNTESVKNDEIGYIFPKTSDLKSPVLLLNQNKVSSKKDIPFKITQPREVNFPQHSQGCNRSKAFPILELLKYQSVNNGYKACVDCSKTHKSNLQNLLKMCEKDPDYIIRVYQNEYSKTISTLDTNDGNSQMKSTHGEILGDAKYHYLMVDASTSTTQLELVPTNIQVEQKSTSTIEENEIQGSIILLTKSSSLVNEATGQLEEGKLNSPAVKQLKSQLVLIKPNSDETLTFESASIKLLSFDHVNPDEALVPQSPPKEETTSIKSDRLGINHSIHINEDRKISVAWSEPDNNKPNIHLIITSSEDEENFIPDTFNHYKDNDSNRKVSMISWNDDPGHNEQSEARKRVEDQIFELNQQKKPITKNSILSDVIKTEKRKSQYPNILEKSEIYDDSTLMKESSQLEEKSRCCGLIKHKNKTPKRSIRARTLENYQSRSRDSSSFSFSDGKSSPRSSLDTYKRRSSSIEHPVFEKKKQINRYSSNL